MKTQMHTDTFEAIELYSPPTEKYNITQLLNIKISQSLNTVSTQKMLIFLNMPKILPPTRKQLG